MMKSINVSRKYKTKLRFLLSAMCAVQVRAVNVFLKALTRELE